MREARSAADIDHPYIAKIYEVGDVYGRHFIAMKYVEGETLKDKMSKGRVPLKEALGIASEAAETIDHAHIRRPCEGDRPLGQSHPTLPHNLTIEGA